MTVPACPQEALTLLAYEKPQESPAAHLFEAEGRERCAAAVNSTLVQMHGCSKDSRLELYCRQAGAVHAELAHEDCVATSVVKLDEVLHGTCLEERGAGPFEAAAGAMEE